MACLTEADEHSIVAYKPNVCHNAVQPAVQKGRDGEPRGMAQIERIPQMIKRSKIEIALDDLMNACGLGESDSETFLHVLSDAIDDVDWEIVERSNDVNALLAKQIQAQLTERGISLQ
jgi:hypothetical protein